MPRPIKPSLMYAVLGERVSLDLALQGDPREVARLAVDSGFEALELMVDPAALDRAVEAAAAARSYGLEVAAISTGVAYTLRGLSLSHPDPAVRERAVKAFTDYIDLAHRLEARVVVVGLARGKCMGDCKGSLERLLQSLRSIERRCVDRSVRLAVEPINWYETDLVNTFEEAARLAEAVECGGLLYDSFHALLVEGDPYKVIDRYGGLIVHVHIADSNRGPPGSGIIDWERLFYRLLRAGYRGHATVEARISAAGGPEGLARSSGRLLSSILPKRLQ